MVALFKIVVCVTLASALLREALSCKGKDKLLTVQYSNRFVYYVANVSLYCRFRC